MLLYLSTIHITLDNTILISKRFLIESLSTTGDKLRQVILYPIIHIDQGRIQGGGAHPAPPPPKIGRM